MEDHMYTFFCAKKYSDYGKFISIVAVQGERRAVIILPEITFNGGWRDFALKIERFINREVPVIQRLRIPVKQIPPKSDENHAYLEAFRTDKWKAKGSSTSAIAPSTNRITVVGLEISDYDVFSRCLVGSFKASKELPTLSDIRRWANSKWSSIPGVQMYGMHGSKFLFEFPSGKLAEHIRVGEWKWRNLLMNFDWWTPTTGCLPAGATLDWVWVRLLEFLFISGIKTSSYKLGTNVGVGSKLKKKPP
uniref:DUF4283 domain-containing protein n=1 Tax=Nicotiana tabacum TaxID=4097 RepID=A0A1S4DJ02_TOBAC|nr:PREDICTED: uncharacterized protein LOC107830322 [Nicotiana tabacum]XP_016513342.1 PREDICTED: uncharacterized protein LOC107830322 [Nicotiana tabacum]